MLNDKPRASYPSNTKRFSSPNNPVSGEGIQSTQSAAMEARERMKIRNSDCRANMPWPSYCMYGGESEKDWEAIGRDDRRKLRGGATFRPGDGILS